MAKRTNAQYQADWYTRQKNPLGVIYRITNVVTGDTYIGRTTNSLKKRLQQHFSIASKRKSPLYQNICEWGKECFEIEAVFIGTPYSDLDEEERKAVAKFNPNLNKNLKTY